MKVISIRSGKALRRQRQQPVEMPEKMGPSNAYLHQVRTKMQFLDDQSEETAALVHEFGYDRAMAVAGRIPYTQARAQLEAERLKLEEQRWRLLPPLKRL